MTIPAKLPGEEGRGLGHLRRQTAKETQVNVPITQHPRAPPQGLRTPRVAASRVCTQNKNLPGHQKPPPSPGLTARIPPLLRRLTASPPVGGGGSGRKPGGAPLPRQMAPLPRQMAVRDAGNHQGADQSPGPALTPGNPRPRSPLCATKQSLDTVPEVILLLNI